MLSETVAPRPLLPVTRPLLPPASAIAPYLAELDAARWYSNFGPMVRRFEARLAGHFGIAPNQLTTVSNGTVGLTLALQALGVRPGRLCLMPAWTFAATPAAAMAAGLTPYFLDVDPRSWSLEPALAEMALARVDRRKIGALIVVSVFGAPVDIAAWDAFSDATGIPVVIDAAAGFDSAKVGRSLTMISLHATKTFGVGEGGLVLSHDAGLIQSIRHRSNFGFNPEREALTVAGNAKLSEYTAAVGMATLDAWPAISADFLGVSRWYDRALRDVAGIALSPGFGEGWVGATCNVRLPGSYAQKAIALLTHVGIESRQSWRQGCHRHPAFGGCPRAPLPVTDALGASVLNVPFYRDMRQADVLRVRDALARAVDTFSVDTRRVYGATGREARLR